MTIPVIIIFLASFLSTLFLLPFWMRKARQLGLMWQDKNKIKEPLVHGSGGVTVVMGFTLGMLLFLAYEVFVIENLSFLVEAMALLLVVVMASGIAFIDDLFGWQKGGLSRRSRLILILFASIPLMAINAGRSDIVLPFIGSTDLGIIYPLILIPLGIVGATTTYNFLAGFNGLEAGLGIILLSSLSLVALFTGTGWLALALIIMVLPLIAFLLYNYYPAKVFPGDSMTYAVGALIAISSILGNFEKIAVFFFIPFILETILKSRGKLVKHSFGKPNKDGSLDMLYPKIYGLTHLSIFLMKKLSIKPTERKVTLSIWAFQLLIVILGFIIFRGGIF